jgi:hypothetical protein
VDFEARAANPTRITVFSSFGEHPRGGNLL